MSILLNERYQFDRTGRALSNLIVDEPHVVSANGARLLVAIEGVMYTYNLTLRLSGSGTPLTLGTDYEYVSVDPEVTAKTNQETVTAISLKNDAIAGTLLLTYQCVGGTEGRSNYFMNQLREAIEAAQNAPGDFRKLRNLPAQFPAAPHPHHVLDLTGLEAVSQALNGIEQALLDSRPLTHSAMNMHFQIDRVLNLIGETNDIVRAFMADYAGLDIERIIEEKIAARWATLMDLFNSKMSLVDQKMALVDAKLALLDQKLLEHDQEIEDQLNARFATMWLQILALFNLNNLDTELPEPVTDPVYDMGEIGVVPVPGPGQEVVSDTIDCGSDLDEAIYDCGTTTGPSALEPGQILEEDTIDCGSDTIQVQGDVYDFGEIGVTPVPGPTDTLITDTVDCGSDQDEETFTIVTGDTVDLGETNGVSEPGAGEVLITDTIDLGDDTTS